MEENDSGCEFNIDNDEDIILRRRTVNIVSSDLPKKKQTAPHNRKTMLINTNDDLIRIAEELYNKDLEKCKENSICRLSTSDNRGSDKAGGTDLRRHSSGYYSNTSDTGNINTRPNTGDRRGSIIENQVLTNKTNCVVGKKDNIGGTKAEYANVKPKIDTGLKKSSSIGGSIVQRCRDPPSTQIQKKSDPIPPQYNKKSTSFKVPDLPPTSGGSFNRNSNNRRSLTRLFGRNLEKETKKTENSSSNQSRTTIGETKKSISLDNQTKAESDEKRNRFTNRRSLTSFSLFSGSNKDENKKENDCDGERKNSFGKLRSARSSLDLSSLGFGSLGKACSKATLTDLKEETDSGNQLKRKETKPESKKSTERAWHDLTRVWKDQTQDLPTDDIYEEMRKERSGRAQTLPSDVVYTGRSDSVSELQILASDPTSFCQPVTPSSCHTPSSLKKTVDLLSPDVLTNWYEKRRKLENLYGLRRDSYSNALRGSEKLQYTSMLNLKELQQLSEAKKGRGVQRSVSAKLTTEQSGLRKGLKRSESARQTTSRPRTHFGLRKNSNPSLEHQLSCSSSTSSLADQSTLESPSKLTTHSLSATEDSGPNSHSVNSGVTTGYNSALGSDGADSSDSELEGDADAPDWRNTLTKEALTNLSSKELKRQDVINELFHTERSHLRNLKVLNRLFREPIIESGRMPSELIEQLFPNIKEVINLHQRFNKTMKSQVKRTGFPVGDISDILSDMFLNDNDNLMVSVCGRFIHNQNSAIEEFKNLRARDGRLDSFLSDMERNPACRRLQLQAILPCVHTRLTKYPLLLQQVSKYTESKAENPKEVEKINSAVGKSKEILERIDSMVAEQQNKARLQEIQSNLDISGLDKMGSDHPVFEEYRFLDLTQHKLVYDGSLTMKLGDSKRVKALNVLLLQDCMMLLQKQGDKYFLKFHSSASSKEDSRDVKRQFHSPIIKFSTMLVRPVATDKRAFYVINTTNTGPQIYELLASSWTERNKWIKYISEASHDYKCQESGMPKAKSEPEELGATSKNKKPDLKSSKSFQEETRVTIVEPPNRQNSIQPDDEHKEKKTEHGEEEESSVNTSPKKRMQRVEILKIVDALPMIDPSQVQVSEAKVLMADPMITPFETLRQKDEEVSRILEEKQCLLSEILHIPDGEFNTMADQATINSNSTDDPREILLAALAQALSLTSFVNSSLTITEKDLVSCSSPGKANVISSESSLFGSNGDQLVAMTTSINHHLTDLLTIIQEKEEERELLKRELVKSQEQVKILLNSSGISSYENPDQHTIFLTGSDPDEDIFEYSGRPQSLISLSSVDTTDMFVITADNEEETYGQNPEELPNSPQSDHVDPTCMDSSLLDCQIEDIDIKSDQKETKLDKKERQEK